MAGRLCCAVGFLGGGGVTPSPTPKPVSQLVRSILVDWSGGEHEYVYLPVDKYGRIIVQYEEEGDVYYCPWWVDGDTMSVFDNYADPILVQAMRDHGYVKAISLGGSGEDFGDMYVTIDGETEHLVWSVTDKEWSMEIPLWQNGQPNMVYRSFEVEGGNYIDAVIDKASGKLCVFDDGDDQWILAVEHNEQTGDSLLFGELADYPELESQVVGVQEISRYDSIFNEESNTYTIVNEDNGIFVCVINSRGHYRDGSAQIQGIPYPVMVREKYGDKYLCDSEGKVIKIEDRTANYFVLKQYEGDDEKIHYEQDHLGGTTIEDYFADWGVDTAESEYADLVYTFVIDGAKFKWEEGTDKLFPNIP